MRKEFMTELAELIKTYKEGLIDTDMEGFSDISIEQAYSVLDDLYCAAENL